MGAIALVFLLATSLLLVVPLPKAAAACTSIGQDGSTVTGTWTSGTTFTLSGLSTSCTGDYIVVEIDTYKYGGTVTVSSITDGGSAISWQGSARYSNTYATYNVVAEWYGTASGALSSDVITVHLSGTPSNAVALAFAVQYTSGFDPNAGLPYSATGSSSTPTVSSVSTSDVNDFVFAEVGIASGSTISSGTINGNTATQQANPISSNANVGGEYYISATTLSSATCTFSISSSSTYDMVCDALYQTMPTVTQPITITPVNGAPAVTITISGCSVSNGTFSGDGYKHTYSGVSASCTITLSTPGTSGNTRYVFNVSPKPTISATVTFKSCASGTCSTYSNSTYYQLLNTYEMTPNSPSMWDASYGPYTWSMIFLGSASNTCGISLVSGSGTASCQGYSDYNQVVTALASFLSSYQLGTWSCTGTCTFTPTTGPNTFQALYNFAAPATSGGGNDLNWYWLVPLILMGMIALFAAGKKVKL